MQKSWFLTVLFMAGKIYLTPPPHPIEGAAANVKVFKINTAKNTDTH